MKLSSSSLTSSAASVPAPTYAQKLASRVEPGQTYDLVGGSQLRILSKSASADGVILRVVVAGHQYTMTGSSFAQEAVISPAMHRLAHFVHRMTASDDLDFDSAVKAAIEEAGLPVDPSMNWSKYLYKMYSPVFARYKDPQRINEKIWDIVTDELFRKRILRSDSEFSRFDSSKQDEGKPLANKVTAFLIDVFQNRKDALTKGVKREYGPGTKGRMGLRPTDSLDAPLGDEDGEDSAVTYGDTVPDNDGRTDAEDRDGEADIQKFLLSFYNQVIKPGPRKDAVLVLGFITSLYLKQYNREEMMDAVLDSTKLKSALGDRLTYDSAIYYIKTWTKLLNKFASDPNNPWSNSAIARHIRDAAKEDRRVPMKTRTKAPTTASLHLADMEENGQPVVQQQPQQVPKPPPPPNPNVQQQNQVRQQNGLNMAPAVNDADPNNDPNQPPTPPNQSKHTIPPEIPGVNHTASEDVNAE